MMTPKQEKEYVINKMCLFFSVFAIACKVAISDYDVFFAIAVGLCISSWLTGRKIIKGIKNNKF